MLKTFLMKTGKVILPVTFVIHNKEFSLSPQFLAQCFKTL